MAFPGLDRTYDSFLFAEIGEDQNGTPVSVLSALARSDREPWSEASRLARLPKREAVLSFLPIMASAAPSFVRPGAVETAARLIALLPSVDAPGQQPSQGRESSPDRRKAKNQTAFLCFAVLLVLACVMSLQAVKDPGPPQVDSRAAVTPISVPAKATLAPQPAGGPVAPPKT